MRKNILNQINCLNLIIHTLPNAYPRTMEYVINTLAQSGETSVQVITNSLGYLLELEGKTLLLKTSCNLRHKT